eukprot:jgi/Tetstr1/441831/TSEL_030047.t1
MDDVVRRFAHSEAVPEEVVRAAVLHSGDEGRELLKYADETTHVEYHRSTCDEGDYHMYCDRTSLVHDAPDEPDEDRLARAASEVLGTIIIHVIRSFRDDWSSRGGNQAMESVLRNAREADLMRVAALLDAREAPAASDRDLVRRIHQMLAGMHVDFRGPAAPRDVKARAPPSYMERVAHMARNPMACKDFAIVVFRAFEKVCLGLNKDGVWQPGKGFSAPFSPTAGRWRRRRGRSFTHTACFASGIEQLDDLACICTTAASAIVAWMESLTTSVIAAEVEVHRQRAARDAPQKQLYENQPHPVLAVSYDPAINQRAMPEEWNGSQEHIVANRGVILRDRAAGVAIRGVPAP